MIGMKLNHELGTVDNIYPKVNVWVFIGFAIAFISWIVWLWWDFI
jgi:hypothetical protein